MLHEFLASNRQILISRCREKVAQRFGTTQVPGTVDRGVPLFLEQLVDTLREEQDTNIRTIDVSQPAPAPTEIGRAAALHGAELLRRGFSVDQVVHDYGDVCQCVTALAVEQKVSVSADEFRTLNRCLDNAIADAVAAFGSARESAIDRETENAHQRLLIFAAEHRRLSDVALQSFSAIQTGNVGTGGATGKLLEHALQELRSLADRALT